MVVAVHTIIL